MKDKTTLACFGLIVLMIVSVLVGAIMNGWVLSVLWGWFVVPLFKVPPLSVASAIGLCLAVGMIVKQSNSKSDDKNRGIGDVMAEIVVAAILSPLFTLFVGWIVKAFI